MGKGTGGDYFDRDVGTSSGGGYSAGASAAMSNQQLNEGCDPRKVDCIETDAENPVVVCMDITGSMGSFPRIIYDKLPMFYGQVMMQGYLEDCAMAFTFYNHPTDAIPVQISPFERGDGIDATLKKLAMKTGGGGDEGLEFPAFYYAFRSKLPPGKKGYFFFIGDSLPTNQEKIPASEIKRLLGIQVEGAMSTQAVFEKLRNKYEVFFISRVPTTHGEQGGDIPPWMMKKLTQYFGEGRVLRLKTAKAVVDIMLGVLATHTGARTWEEYIGDMRERGQTEERIAEVHWAFDRRLHSSSSPRVAGAPVRKGAPHRNAPPAAAPQGGSGGGSRLQGNDELVKEVARLFVLHKAGALTEREFADAKASLLGS
eukprot:TRINITY_DN46914_c0_g1_i1.p1 TRINITY_DN46914_c0_g1~~TRINITY_DN46914_c0_g1_i1.p1  ORF type:complete len:369 (+),score=140.73 TRINITY_DN46914_c0_g1_i1:92-1198(+)